MHAVLATAQATGVGAFASVLSLLSVIPDEARPSPHCVGGHCVGGHCGRLDTRGAPDAHELHRGR